MDLAKALRPPKKDQLITQRKRPAVIKTNRVSRRLMSAQTVAKTTRMAIQAWID